MLKEMLENVKKNSPLVHNITNYVTVNDCANILIACGGSPIMADDSREVEEITSICGGLNINIGTLNQNTISSMFLAGKKANELSHPIVLDPVGAGASLLRTETAIEILKKVQVTVIRGNISEIKTLALGSGETKGVDANTLDTVSNENLDKTLKLVHSFAKKQNAIIAISGAIDIVADDKTAFVIRNGHPMMAQITGSGCMLSALICAYLVANKDDYLRATAAAFCAMGLCGEKAYNKLIETGGGNSSYRNYLIDEIYNLTGDELENGAKYELQ